MIRLVVLRNEKTYVKDFANICLAYQYYLQNFITKKELKHIEKYQLKDTTDTDLIEVLFKHCFVNTCILDENFI